MSVIEQLLRRLRAVPDSTGAALTAGVRARRGAVLVVRVADDEPFFRGEELLALAAPEVLLGGLGALALVGECDRVMVAIRADYRRLWALLPPLVEGTRIELVALAPRYPLDARSLAADLLSEGRLTRSEAERLWVVDAQAAVDAGHAAAGRQLGLRSISIAGEVQRPGVYQVPLGAVADDLVAFAGGARVGGWVVLHNGWLGGVVDGGECAVGWETRGLVIASSAHPWVMARRLPSAERLARVTAACNGCRLCSERCPAVLDGATRLLPDILLRELGAGALLGEATAADRHSRALLGALECRDCGLCSALCPASLDPAGLIAAVARRLRGQGVALGGRAPLAPIAQRGDRRVAVAELEARFEQLPQPTSPYRCIPGRLTIPLRGRAGAELAPLVAAGERVAAGQLIAHGQHGGVDLCAPLRAEVEGIDQDLGLVLTPLV